jgi:hypothetical protein
MSVGGMILMSGKPKYSEGNCFSVALSTAYPTGSAFGANEIFRAEKPEGNV